MREALRRQANGNSARLETHSKIGMTAANGDTPPRSASFSTTRKLHEISATFANIFETARELLDVMPDVEKRVPPDRRY